MILHVPYDSETDSDSRIVGLYKTQKEALMILWEERFNAY